MQPLTYRSIKKNFGILRHPVMAVPDLIRYYESIGYRYRHRSIRSGYISKMIPGNCIVANYNGRFGIGVQIIEGVDPVRVNVYYLIYKGRPEDAKT